MKLQRISEALLGKRVRHCNPLTGTICEFNVSIITEVVHAVCFYSPEKNCRIFVSKDNVEALISDGYYVRVLTGTDGTFVEEWRIID